MASCTLAEIKVPVVVCGGVPPISTAFTYCPLDNAPASVYRVCDAQEPGIPASSGLACYDCGQMGASTTQSKSSTSSKISPSPTSTHSTEVPSTTNLSASPAGTRSVSLPTGSNNGTSGTPVPTIVPVASSKKGDVTKGAAAGIGIGAALFGALAAALILFFLFRRKRGTRNSPEDHLGSNGAMYGDREKDGVSAAVVPIRGGVVTNVDHLLPMPAEDDAIKGGLSRIRDAVKNHVQNYYHNGPITQAIDETRLSELAHALNLSPSSTSGLFINPATRFAAIRLFLAHSILSRCVGRTDGRESLLPIEISVLAGYQNTHPALFSKWKTISGALLNQKYSQQLSDTDPRLASISQTLSAIEPVLQPFANPNTDPAARHRNLEGIMKRAAQFAFLLFSQPGSFHFDFSGANQLNNLVVFPSLLQTVNDEAEPLSPPRVLTEKEIVSGLGP